MGMKWAHSQRWSFERELCFETSLQVLGLTMGWHLQETLWRSWIFCTCSSPSRTCIHGWCTLWCFLLVIHPELERRTRPLHQSTTTTFCSSWASGKLSRAEGRISSISFLSSDFLSAWWTSHATLYYTICNHDLLLFFLYVCHLFPTRLCSSWAGTSCETSSSSEPLAENLTYPKHWMPAMLTLKRRTLIFSLSGLTTNSSPS